MMKKNDKGYLLFDKPCGWTSYDCVNFFKRRFGYRKVGHAGTLDPLATGVLVLLFGEGTKWFDHFQKGTKVYETTFFLGAGFDAQDITGQLETLDLLDKVPSKGEVEKALQIFKGKSLQTPPKYSALKVRGKPAYERVRDGEEVKLAPREVEIQEISLLAYDYPHISLRVRSSKGMYVRQLCEDIANKFGTRGSLISLRRIEQGGFSIQKALSVQDIRNVETIELSVI